MKISKASDESLDRGFPDVIRLSLSRCLFGSCRVCLWIFSDELQGQNMLMFRVVFVETSPPPMFAVIMILFERAVAEAKA